MSNNANRIFVSLRTAIAILVLSGVSAIAGAPAAHASSDVTQPVTAQSSTWGAGPIMVSLVEVARKEKPVTGLEKTTADAEPIKPIQMQLPQQPVAVPQSDRALKQALSPGAIRPREDLSVYAQQAQAPTPVSYLGQSR